jgi:hypothetical protein
MHASPISFKCEMQERRRALCSSQMSRGHVSIEAFLRSVCTTATSVIVDKNGLSMKVLQLPVIDKHELFF